MDEAVRSCRGELSDALALLLQEALPAAPFAQARVLGSLILVDTASHKTAAAVLVN